MHNSQAISHTFAISSGFTDLKKKRSVLFCSVVASHHAVRNVLSSVIDGE